MATLTALSLSLLCPAAGWVVRQSVYHAQLLQREEEKEAREGLTA